MSTEVVRIFVDSEGDKRSYLRATVNNMMHVVLLEVQNVKNIDVWVDNISFGGIGFYSKDAIKVGTELVLKLSLVKEYNLEGKILYVRKKGDRYYHGVQFKPFKSEVKENALYTFMESKIDEK